MSQSHPLSLSSSKSVSAQRVDSNAKRIVNLGFMVMAAGFRSGLLADCLAARAI